MMTLDEQNEYYNQKHLDAWRAGAYAMFEWVTDSMDELTEDGYKKFKEEAKVFIEKRGTR